MVDHEGLFSPEVKESSVAADREAEQSLWFFVLLRDPCSHSREWLSAWKSWV